MIERYVFGMPVKLSKNLLFNINILSKLSREKKIFMHDVQVHKIISWGLLFFLNLIADRSDVL